MPKQNLYVIFCLYWGNNSSTSYMLRRSAAYLWHLPMRLQITMFIRNSVKLLLLKHKKY